ncbi:MAG: uncharacterized protein PWQ87_832 [Candidatus Woesearchaeota archaeon]|nr:uncharacterized protein [Candidatus Woesearchaeota archaeon]
MNGIKIYKEGIIIERSKTLIISDLHLGYYDTNITGVRIADDIIERIESMIKEIKPKEIVFNGDILHHFGKISGLAKRELKELLGFLKKRDIELILIRGNHDKLLDYYLNDLGIPVKARKWTIRHRNLICHGDKIININRSYDRIIIGHEHPHVKLVDGIREEIFKCFLITKYKGKELIVMPAFSSYSVGSNVLDKNFLSPYLKNSDDYEDSVILALDEIDKSIVNFGRIKDIKNIQS